ncbi:MAG TPA: GntR family transcriptional regulator [Kofleriaceae bacterium]|jgi:GntR family transcriptional repressor for pyruvate dehydrogenase complex
MATAISIAPTTTAIDAIFEKLLAAIVSGQYAAGVRLPAERELSRQLGASRPTLREALRRLDEWNLVEPRRGSGIVVRPYRDWSIEVLAAYVRYGKPTPEQPTTARILLDLLAIRRALVLEVIRLTASRVPKGGTALARSAMARAWSLRDSPQYVREDFEVMRAITEAARFTPGLWLLNRMAELWMNAADELRMVLRPPDDYVAVHSRFFELLEANDTVGACDVMAAYLERHDAKLSAALQVLA